MVEFTTRDGEVKSGRLVHQYRAFEGDMRYIIVDEAGREWRCSKIDNEYVEYVA